MTASISSSRKVSYDLRPKKQVERRMMVHVFQQLAESGFPLSTYRYVGFGAFFFMDFILFRRLLGITDMVSIEHDDFSEKRVRFNCPFNDIEVKIMSASEYICIMDQSKPHLLWLDYDGAINSEYLADMVTSAYMLSARSILIVTFDVDFEKASINDDKKADTDQRSGEWRRHFKKQCRELNFHDQGWSDFDFTASNLSKRTTEVIQKAISSGLNLRDNITFQPLFNFQYGDGHQMLTVGGVICSQSEKEKIRNIDWTDFPFIRRDFSEKPFKIRVPVLTRKERLYIDSKLPCKDGWPLDDLGISLDIIKEYSEVYRYCPLYAELLL